jgi:hypothetical protein
MTVRKSLSQREAYIVIGSRGRIPINEETTLVYPVVERLGRNNHRCAAVRAPLSDRQERP